jgi:hypothetical protein
MKPLALILILALPAPALAQEDGPSLMERGAQMFFRGLMQEMDPAMRGLRDLVEEAGPAMENFIDEMGPALVDLFGKVRDFSVYHPPEILPNGDIIMRKKTEGEREAQPEATPETGKQIEL